MPTDNIQFDPLILDQINRFGPVRDYFPRSFFATFERSAINKVGVGFVGLGIVGLGLWLSFNVVVSEKPEEQFPFQSAMWGFAAVGGILAAYGFFDAIRRSMLGIANLGRWWIVLDRGFVILNNGAVEKELPLADLRVIGNDTLKEPLQLMTADGKAISTDARYQRDIALGVQKQQRAAKASAVQTTAASSAAATPKVHKRAHDNPFVYAWHSAWMWDDDRIYRIYHDGKDVLVVSAGPFSRAKLGVNFKGLPFHDPKEPDQPVPGWFGDGEFEKRYRYLNGLSIEELRHEAALNKNCAVLNVGNTKGIVIEPPLWGNMARWLSSPEIEKSIAGRVRFFHKGWLWRLMIFRQQEMEFVIECLREAFGDDAVKE